MLQECNEAVYAAAADSPQLMSQEFSAVEPHVTGAPLSTDSRYLVCSDGLSDKVPTDEVARILHQHEDERAAFELWKAAIEAGGRDNITLAVVRLAD